MLDLDIEHILDGGMISYLLFQLFIKFGRKLSPALRAKSILKPLPYLIIGRKLVFYLTLIIRNASVRFNILEAFRVRRGWD